MKRTLLAALVAALASPALAAAPPPGGDLYKQNCASCHGADAKGGTAPAIAGKLPGDVAKVIGNHKPPLEKKDLTPDQMASISRYVGSLKKKK